MHFGPVVDETTPYISGRRWTRPDNFFSVDGDNVDGEPTDALELGSIVQFNLTGHNNHPVPRSRLRERVCVHSDLVVREDSWRISLGRKM